MGYLGEAFFLALGLLTSFDADLFEVIFLSLRVSFFAVFVACLVGFILGSILASNEFPGKRFIVIIHSSLMGAPPVVVGLFLYIMLSRSGPFGALGLLYTPAAMTIAQIFLVTPLVISLSYQALNELHNEYDEFFRSIRLSGAGKVRALLWDGRHALAMVMLAGFGRAISEVGAVIIVGGNINHLTRVMTTAIALETSKGSLAMALALGIVLISLSIAVNAFVLLINSFQHEKSGA